LAQTWKQIQRPQPAGRYRRIKFLEMHRAAIVIQSFFKMIVQRKQYLSIQNFMLNLQSRN
ncbi:hypothetical protein T03_6590, partial [Trichinella britovi]